MKGFNVDKFCLDDLLANHAKMKKKGKKKDKDNDDKNKKKGGKGKDKGKGKGKNKTPDKGSKQQNLIKSVVKEQKKLKPLAGTLSGPAVTVKIG